MVTDDDPLTFNAEPVAPQPRPAGRGSYLYAQSMSSAEREIELKLDRPFTVEFKQRPLREVLQDLRLKAEVNITTDDAAIGDEQITLDQPVTETMTDVSLRNVLTHRCWTRPGSGTWSRTT